MSTRKNLSAGAQAAKAGERVYRPAVRPRQLAGIEALAADWDADPTEIVNTAIREFLERHGRWAATAAAVSESGGSQTGPK